MDGNNNYPDWSRRKLLTATSAAVIGTPVVAGSATGVSSDGYEVSLRSEDDKPIELSEIKRERDQVIDQYDRNEGFDDDVPKYSPDLSGDTDIYAYNLKISSGVPKENYIKHNSIESDGLNDRLKTQNQTLTADRSEPVDVEPIEAYTAQADEWLEDQRSTESNSAELRIHSTDWTKIGSVDEYMYNPPAGVLNKTYSLYSSPSDEKDYALQTDIAMESGRNIVKHENDGRYSSNAQNSKALVEHDWDQWFDCSYEDNYPETPISVEKESIDFRLEAGTTGVAGSIGLTYTQPANTVTDESSTHVGVTRGNLEMERETLAARTRATFTPASLFELEQTHNCRPNNDYSAVEVSVDAAWSSGMNDRAASVLETDTFQMVCFDI